MLHASCCTSGRTEAESPVVEYRYASVRTEQILRALLTDAKTFEFLASGHCRAMQASLGRMFQTDAQTDVAGVPESVMTCGVLSGSMIALPLLLTLADMLLRCESIALCQTASPVAISFACICKHLFVCIAMLDHQSCIIHAFHHSYHLLNLTNVCS